MSYGDWLGEDRRVRAYRMYTDAADHHIARTFARRGVYVVRSQRRAGITYSVSPARKTCTCPDFRRNAPATVGFLCKHLYLVAIVQRGGRLLRVRGRIDFGDGSYLEGGGDDDTATGDGAMAGHFAVKALAPHHAFVVDIASGRPVCGHAHDEAKLRAWFTSGAMAKAASPCPHCIGGTMDLLIVGAPSPKVLSDADQKDLRAEIRKRGGNARIIDDVLTRYYLTGDLWFFDLRPTDDDYDELKKEVVIGPEVFKMMLGLADPPPSEEEFNTKIPDDVTYEYTHGKGKSYDPLNKDPDLDTLWKRWDPRTRIVGNGREPGKWSGKTQSKREKQKALYDLVFDYVARSTGAAIGKGRAMGTQGVVVHDSMRKNLDDKALPEFRARVYGQSRCDEVVSRNLGLATLSSYQKIIQWSFRGGVKNAHSFLLYHDTGAGKTASLWLALGDAWKEQFGRFRQKYFFVTKQSLSNQQQPAKDVWAFYHAAGGVGDRDKTDSYKRIHDQKSEGNKGPEYVRWKTYLPTEEPGATTRIVSYKRFAGICRRSNAWGRTIYDYEAGHEIADRLASGALGSKGEEAPKEPEDRAERVLSGLKEPIPVDEFPAALGNIAVARSARTYDTLARDDKDAENLKNAREALMERMEYEAGVRRAWDHLKFLKASGDGEPALQMKFGIQALRATIEQKMTAMRTTAGDGASENLFWGPIDPLRNAVIAIDEADVLFSGTSEEIGDTHVGVIERAIFWSYEHSGDSAVRVVLGTATPAHLSVKAAFRLLNVLVRDKKDRVQGVGSGGAAFEDNYVDAAKSPKIAMLVGKGDFDSAAMNLFMNVVKDGISRVDLTYDFDHFPHRIRKTVDVDPSPEHATHYNAVLKRAFKLPKDPPVPAQQPPPGDPGEKVVQTPASKIRSKARKLRNAENIVVPKGETTVPFEFRLGHPKFDSSEFADWINTKSYTDESTGQPAEALAYNNAPKLMALLKNIRYIDETARKDPNRPEGMPLPKHAIICDAKKEFGAPLVAAALSVAGYPWRPIQRYREDKKERVKLMDTTISTVSRAFTSPFDSVEYQVREDDTSKSAFVVLSAQQLDFKTETGGDDPFLQRGVKANENTEYTFVGGVRLRELLGRTGLFDKDDPIGKIVKKIKGSKIFRPSRSPDYKSEDAHHVRLETLFLRKSESDNPKADNVYAIIKPLLKVMTGTESSTDNLDIVRHVRDNIDAPKSLTIEHLQGLDLIEWRAVLSEKQRRDAPKSITKRFNSRKDNFENGIARIIVVAPEFSTGTDLFEVENIHLFDSLEKMEDGKDAKPKTRDRAQMEGRAWRFCGHSELRRRFGRETDLDVYDYRLNAGRVAPEKVLEYMRNTAGREPGVAVTKTAKTEKPEAKWKFDDVLQALRTDPADAVALNGINAKIEEYAFDKTQNDIPKDAERTPLYTGYVHMGEAATPLYRSAKGKLVDVNGSVVEGVDGDLWTLWNGNGDDQNVRVRWDRFAGAWTGVADREQSVIERDLANQVGNQLAALIQLANAAFVGGKDMEASMAAVVRDGGKSVRDEHSDTVLHLDVLRNIIANQKAIQKKRKQGSNEYKKYAGIISVLEKDLLGFAQNEETLARQDLDTASDGEQTVSPRSWWRARAALYRARYTLLPLRHGRDLQWEGTTSTGAARAQPRRAAAAEALPRRSLKIDNPQGRPSDNGWYTSTRKLVLESAERAGFINERRLARDLWFGSHVTPDLGYSLFVDAVAAYRRMRITAGEGADSIASYIWHGFEGLGADRRIEVMQDVMTDQDLLAGIVRIATWLPAHKFRVDARLFVGDLGVALPTAVARIGKYALAPGQTGRKRRVAVMRDLVSATLEKGSITNRINMMLDAIFGSDYDQSVRRTVFAHLPSYYSKLHAYEAREVPAEVKPDLASGIVRGVADVIRFFAKPSRLAPSLYFTRIMALGRRLARPSGGNSSPHIWIAAVLMARVVEEGAIARKPAEKKTGAKATSMHVLTAKAIEYLYSNLDDLPEDIKCYAAMRKEGVLAGVMSPDNEKENEGVTHTDAADILYQAYGDYDVGKQKAREIIKGKKRPVYLKIADTEEADVAFPGGRGEPLLRMQQELKDIKKHKLRYAGADGKLIQVAGVALDTLDAGGHRMPWFNQIGTWFSEGLVEITNVGKLSEIPGMESAAKLALVAVCINWAPWLKQTKKTAPEPVRNAVNAYITSLGEGGDTTLAKVREYLNSRSGALHWTGDDDKKRNFFSLIAGAEVHWDAVIALVGMVMRVFVTLDKKIAMRIAVSGERPTKIGQLDLASNGAVGKFIAGPYTVDVRAISDVVKGLKNALAEASTNLAVSQNVLASWILDGPEGMPGEFAELVKSRGTDAYNGRILTMDPFPRGIAIQTDIRDVFDPRNVYFDILGSVKAKELVKVFAESLKPKPAAGAAPQLPGTPLPLPGQKRQRAIRPFANIYVDVRDVLKELGLLDGGVVTVDDEEVNATDVDIRAWNLEEAESVYRKVKSVRKIASQHTQTQIKKRFSKMRTALRNARTAQALSTNVIGAALDYQEHDAGTKMLSVKEQPLIITHPPHLRGGLIPVDVSRKLVWRAEDYGGDDRLVLAKGRAALPSGVVLDAWESGEIVAEFF